MRANWLVIFSLNNRWRLSHCSTSRDAAGLLAPLLGPSHSGREGLWGAEEEDASLLPPLPPSLLFVSPTCQL